MRKVLKASAGTGKTYSLSLEYLLALLNGDSFEEIVVMTFTRKATAEIRDRIFEHLEELIEEGEESQVFQSLEEKKPLVQLNPVKIKDIYQQMLKNKDKIHIYTIDSFINRIFKKSISSYLGILNYQIVEEEKNREIIEEVFKEILDNPADFALMERFLSDNLERDLNNYLNLIEGVLKNRWKFLLINQERREKRDSSQLIIHFDQSLEILESIAFEKGKEFSSEFLVKDFQLFIPEYRQLSSLEAKRNMIKKNYFLFFNKHFWNGSKIRGNAVASLKMALELKYEDFLKQLANCVYNEDIIPYEEEIFKFSNRVFEITDKLKFKLKSFTHTDISNYTYMYLKSDELGLMDNDLFTDYFYELLGIKIKSIFIDEFQDTSILQWKILKGLLDKSINVITVGDAKQSIYGWRGGEKELFSNLDKILSAETEDLLTCYRSQKEILDFVNKFFSNLEIDWDYKNVVNLRIKDKGYLELLMGGESCKINTESKKFAKYDIKKQEEIEARNEKIVSDMKREIAHRIKELPQGSDIAVLARSNKHLSDIAIEFDKLGVPYLLESKESLLEHEAISPLYYLLSYLNYNDYFMLLKFLRSDLIGINNSSLRYLLENKDEIKKYMNGIVDEIDFKDIENLLFEIKKLHKEDYQSLINSLFEKSGIVNKYSKNSAALKNIYHFFQLMRGYGCLSDFMRFLDENKESEQLKQLAVREENAVKLMSIHKSKGLSFESEFFYWDPSPTKGRHANSMEFYLSFDENYQEVEDYLLTNSKYEKLFEYLSIDFAEENKERELIEEINNLYVALTRAEKNLFIYIEGPRNLELDSEGYCWSGSSYSFYEKALLRASDTLSICELIEGKEFGELMISPSHLINNEVYLPDLKNYFTSCQVDNNLDYERNKLSMDNELKRIEGLALHYFLENIKYNSQQECNYAYQLMLARYGNILGSGKCKKIRKRVEEFIKANSSYFDKSWQVYNEYQLDFVGEKYRIDRLLLNQEKKEIIILDYKSGYSREEAQLEKYKEIVKIMSGDKYKIKTKFLDI